MSNVLVEKNKLDILANAISNKSGEPLKLTLAEMVEAVDGIETGGGGGTPTLETITKTYTPSTSAVTDTITASAGYDGIEEVDVTVSAVPIGGRGIPSWTKGTSSTVYTLIASFPNVTAGYVSSIPAISTTLSLENKVVEPTENQQTVEPTDIGCYLNSVTVNAIPSNYVGSGITQRSSSDLTASTLTVTAPSGYYASNATKTLSDQNLVAGNIKKDVQIFGVTGNYEGGSGSDVQVASANLYSASTGSLLFTGLQGEPTSFIALCGYTLTPSTTPQVVAVVYDGTNLHAQTITNTNNAQVSYASTGFSYFYNSGALQIESTGSAVFNTSAIDSYGLFYTYDGTSGNIHTADVQVGSGATSITFTGLEDEPLYWSCIFKSNFSTSSGYQRVITTADNGDSVIGYEMDSSAHPASHWTSSYNNGSLTITSNGTNAGGYFHQPGYYQLTYAISGDQTLQTKTVTPTTSTQNVTADTAQGYTALKKVVVNPIPSSYVQPTSTVGATTYRASTSSQTIASGTYHSAAATIAAVSQTNLTAANIKNGTTITISNGQSDLWSVTGTYTGGGSSMNVQVAQSTNRATSSTYTSLVSLTCSTAGTYDIYWDCFRSNTGGTNGSQLYIGGKAYGTANTTFTNHAQTNHLTGVTLQANQTVAVYARSRGSNYYAYVGTLIIKQTA